MHVYFSQAIEGLDRASVINNFQRVSGALERHGFRMSNREVYESFDYQVSLTPAEIVEMDLQLLSQSRFLLVDMTLPSRNYVGCVCEIVYAFQLRKPVVVFVGDTDNNNRLWLRYHAFAITKNLDEAIEVLRNLSPE